MEIKKDISKGQFMYFFGELHNMLKRYKKPTDGYYLTCVIIEDVPSTNQIKVTFSVEYGPAGVMNDTGSVDAVMMSSNFGFVYNKNGQFKGYTNEDPKDYSYLHSYPGYFTFPSYKDFPDQEDLFCIVSRIILKCCECGKPLSSILFTSPYLSYSGDGEGGIPAYQDGGGYTSSFNGVTTGICLKSDMDGARFSYILREDTNVRGEYSLIFRVNFR